MEENSRLVDPESVAQRLREAIAPEKASPFADRAGVPHPTVFKYLKPPANFSPSLEIIAKLAEAAGVTLDWLALGRGEGPVTTTGFAKIPRYDATLAAGAGSWNDGRRRLDDIPFTQAFLNKRLGRTSTAGLAILEAKGDSMEPTISDGALVMVDEADTRLIDGVFAFLLDGDARIKRFRKRTDGVEIISDNPAYPPELVAGKDLKRLQIIGRTLWVGQLL
jgi:phage repressor protein C with HTH and peptisase S24 domain